MLKIIGAGLGRTGTTSLHEALTQLGFASIHFDEHRLNDVLDGSTKTPDFRRYDDIDAVCDVPSALFYNELMEAYPGSKVILTVRDIDGWWRSISQMYTDWAPVSRHPGIRPQIAERTRFPFLSAEAEGTVFRRNLRYCAFGSPEPVEHLYKRAYLQHNAAVIARTPPDRLLVMDITAGDGWEKLCGFLGVPVPSTPFPSVNKSLRAPDRAVVQDSSPAPRQRHRGLGRLSPATALVLAVALATLGLLFGWRGVQGEWSGLEQRAGLLLPGHARFASKPVHGLGMRSLKGPAGANGRTHTV